jgi:flagellin-like protein
MRENTSRRAVSPVISTVVLVAVAIAVSVAVAYWMGGIAGQYTKFEKVEMQTGVCTRDPGGGNWTIKLKLKNTGTAASTLIGCFVNDIEVNTYDVDIAGAGEATTNMTSSETISSGATRTINVYVDDAWGAPVTSGTTVNIKIISAGGMEYLKLIELV